MATFSRNKNDHSLHISLPARIAEERISCEVQNIDEKKKQHFSQRTR